MRSRNTDFRHAAVKELGAAYQGLANAMLLRISRAS